MHPLLSLLRPSATGGNAGKRRLVWAMAPMGLHHDDGAALALLVSYGAEKIIPAPDTTSHPSTEQRIGVLIKRGAQDIRDGQNEVTRDHPVMEPLTDLSDPVVDIDLGASQTERGLTAHRHEVLALATVLTAVRDVTHLVGIPAAEPLLDERIIVGPIVAGTALCKAAPVIGKDLFEDIPAGSDFGSHGSVPC